MPEYHWVKTNRGERYTPVAETPGTVDPRRRSGSVWGRPQRIRALAVHNEEACEFNTNAPPGVRYVPGADGWANCEVDSRAARKAESVRRGVIDRDGGYGDNTNLKEGWPIKKSCAKRSRPGEQPTIAEIREWAAATRHERTHAGNCWKRHPECLASILLDRIDELEFLKEIHGDD